MPPKRSILVGSLEQEEYTLGDVIREIQRINRRLEILGERLRSPRPLSAPRHQKHIRDEDFKHYHQKDFCDDDSRLNWFGVTYQKCETPLTRDPQYPSQDCEEPMVTFTNQDDAVEIQTDIVEILTEKEETAPERVEEQKDVHYLTSYNRELLFQSKEDVSSHISEENFLEIVAEQEKVSHLPTDKGEVLLESKELSQPSELPIKHVSIIQTTTFEELQPPRINMVLGDLFDYPLYTSHRSHEDQFWRSFMKSEATSSDFWKYYPQEHALRSPLGFKQNQLIREKLKRTVTFARFYLPQKRRMP